jgi:hypothetical protein
VAANLREGLVELLLFGVPGDADVEAALGEGHRDGLSDA